MRLGNNELTIGQQVRAMASLFPQFEYRRKRNKRGRQYSAWQGTLQPTNGSPVYTIKMILPAYYPSVWVLAPQLSPNAPHIYTEDQSLCLYYPSDRSWNRQKLLAETIVPWTAEWLYLYELWCVTGEWYGGEAPHNEKRRAKK